MVDLIASMKSGIGQYNSFNAHNANQAAIKLQQQGAEDQSYRDAVNNLGAIAIGTGYSTDGITLDRDKLMTDYEKAANGESVPSLDKFNSLVLNTDLAKNGKIAGFSFDRVTPGPEGTVTAEGRYEDGTAAPLTVNRSADPNDPPAFATPADAVGALINQYDELRYDPRFAQQNIDASRLGNVARLENKKIGVKGQLTAQLLEGLRAATQNTGEGEAFITRVKSRLATMSPDEQIAFMRDEVAPALGQNIKQGLNEEQAQLVDQAGKGQQTGEGQQNNLRPDGTTKSQQGFLGQIPNNATGEVMTEASISVNIDGKKVLIPTLVPTLTQEEIKALADMQLEGNAKNIPASIQQKAVEHAKQRIAAGKDPFYQDSEGEQAAFKMSEEEAETKTAKLIRRIEKNKGRTTGGRNKVDDSDRAKSLERHKKSIQRRLSNLASLEKDLDISRPGKIAELKAELELLNRYQSGGSTEAAPQGDAKTAVTKATEKTVQQVEQGDVPQFSNKELQAFKDHLASKGITSLAEAYKATDEELITLRAIIATSSEDPESRKFALEQFDNVIQTGNPGFNAVELSAAQNQQTTAEANLKRAEAQKISAQRLRDQQRAAEAGRFSKDIEAVNDAIYDLFWDKADGTAKNVDIGSFKQLFSSSKGPQALLQKWRTAQQQVDRNPRNIAAKKQSDTLRASLLSNLSLYLQVLNKEGDQEWSWSTDSDYQLNAGDSALDYIAIDAYAKGEPTQFIIRNPASGKQDGDAISASQLKEALGPSMYDFFVANLKEVTARRKDHD